MTASTLATPGPAIGRVGRYLLNERIGGNATSTVYSAREDASGRPIAIKMIAAELEDERETRARFFREAQVTADLAHPNVVAIHEVGEDHGHPFIAMELLSGLPLGDYLRQANALTLEGKLTLMIQLCAGLQAAHDRGIVHRDIKPTNLFVTEDGTLKILDFGLARLQESTLTARGQIVGTPDFMSPEQAEGRRADHRSDLFSAAAVGYLIVTGRSPFARANLRETLNALLSEAPPPIGSREVPDALHRVLAKGLAKEPAARYQRAADMRADLARVRHATGLSMWKRLAAFVALVRA